MQHGEEAALARVSAAGGEARPTQFRQSDPKTREAVMQLAGRAGIFGAFIVVYFVVLVYSLYTRRGSAINQRPYSNPAGDAPGATGSSQLAHDYDGAKHWS